MFVQLWMSIVIVAHSCSRTSTLATCPHIGVTAMAGVRRMSWPWSSLRLRLSASRSEDSSSASSYSPSPSAKEVCTHVCMNLLVVGTLHTCMFYVCMCLHECKHIHMRLYCCVCAILYAHIVSNYHALVSSCVLLFAPPPPPPPLFLLPTHFLHHIPDFAAHTGA